MTAAQWTPSAEAVEAEARRLFLEQVAERSPLAEWPEDSCRVAEWKRQATFILRRQHERESGLLLAVAQLATLGGGHSDGNRIAQAALAAHAKLDAPKVPTLLEAATAYVQSRHNNDDIRCKARADLLAAAEREERK